MSNDDQKAIASDFYFTNFLKKRKIFWEWFLISNELSGILGSKKSSHNQEKLLLF